MYILIILDIQDTNYNKGKEMFALITIMSNVMSGSLRGCVYQLLLEKLQDNNTSWLDQKRTFRVQCTCLIVFILS